ncbi:folylpolyglutamate synthase isoform X2 [Diospyros lotus]|uniref:folylpolyglutamate synthase isoform X2 n=1 Tax=Diospyros lotus TaxID=55363 RepID=UPI00224F3930|nr:folylpolyglutamate synthase isoform X2 [Diospyros lotus]XP_052175746.1 folylpolyglutamate synthase isoform X2 [Diospyros lotus]
MFIQTNTDLRQGITGVTFSHPRRCQYSHRLTGTGFRYTKISSEFMEKPGSNLVIKENLQDLPLSPAYETVMEALSSLITTKKRGDRPAVEPKYRKLDGMMMYIKILGLEEHIAGLNIIHVAGTKGKGSTCTFCEAILRESGFKTGLFTSPHLIDVRERFRLDGLDISVEKFLLYFWECWNQLKESISEDLPMPPLFQFFTLLAFKIFISEKVDVAIIEVGLGGENDSTNVIKKPVVCGITSLGMDHMETLGDTLGQIASQKAGIFKPQVPAFTVLQLSEAMDVIQARACELMIPLEVVPPLDPRTLGGLTLGLSGEHQFINAGLAVSLCKSWLRSTGNWQKLFQNGSQEDILPEAFLRGLSTACLSGRAQIIHEPSLSSCSSSEVKANSSGDLIFYLDGAHSPESMEACARWFSSAVKVNKHLSSSSSSYKVGNVEKLGGNDYTHHEMDKESGKILKRVLLFNCMEVRDPQVLLPQLVNTCASSGTHFSKAIFVPSMSTYRKVTSGMSVIPADTPARDLSWQFNLQKIWEKMIHGKDAVADKGSKIDGLQTLPPHEFLYQDSSHCNPADRHFACSAVIPTLPLTINWLRDCAKRYPSLRIQVLVTGSIHLVGDVLKLLRR